MGIFGLVFVYVDAVLFFFFLNGRCCFVLVCGVCRVVIACFGTCSFVLLFLLFVALLVIKAFSNARSHSVITFVSLQK